MYCDECSQSCAFCAGTFVKMRARAEEAMAEVARLRALLEAAEVDKIRVLDTRDDEVERLRAALRTALASVVNGDDGRAMVAIQGALAGDRSTSVPPGEKP